MSDCDDNAYLDNGAWFCWQRSSNPLFSFWWDLDWIIQLGSQVYRLNRDIFQRKLLQFIHMEKNLKTSWISRGWDASRSSVISQEKSERFLSNVNLEKISMILDSWWLCWGRWHWMQHKKCAFWDLLQLLQGSVQFGAACSNSFRFFSQCHGLSSAFSSKRKKLQTNVCSLQFKDHPWTYLFSHVGV